MNNYPPLSYYTVAALSSFGLDPVYAGRFLSLLSIVAITITIALLIRHFKGSRLAAFVGAMWFLATFAHFLGGSFGANDPNAVALAIMSGALFWLLRRQASGQTAYPAIALMVLGGFYKHNLVSIPLTAIGWLALENSRSATRAALFGAALTFLGLSLCYLA
jgi:uncharacterized membrane protein